MPSLLRLEIVMIWIELLISMTDVDDCITSPWASLFSVASGTIIF